MEDEIRARLRETGRNDPCPCGSGKKYKKCHQESDSRASREADQRRAEQQAQEVEAEPAAEDQTDERERKKAPRAPFQGKRRSEKIHSGNKSGAKSKKSDFRRRSNG